MVQGKQIDVIVIGAGYAGLSCAIELKKKGCRVRLFETLPSLTTLGKIPVAYLH
jgi:phytoene dehydrogenase-like protein